MPRKTVLNPLLALLLAAAAPAAVKPKLGVYKGYVQVFSHVAVTVRSQYNRNALVTFTFSGNLRQRLLNRHLVYGEKITVYYQPTSLLAVRIKAKQYPGS
jgi:hypothetical protein